MFVAWFFDSSHYAEPDQRYWTSLHRSSLPEYRPEKILFRDIFAKFVRPRISTFEVGCYPGRYMIYLAKTYGCRVSGIDYTDDFDRMVSLLEAHNVKPVELLNGDFMRQTLRSSYEFVYSLGFVEHFKRFDEVIRRHASLVRPGGLLFLAAPNFRGLQYVLRLLLDREDLGRHYLPSMHLGSWRRVLVSSGMKILWDGYYGTFGFWVSRAPDWPLGRRLAKLLRSIGPRINARLSIPNPLTSPYLVSVSQKA